MLRPSITNINILDNLTFETKSEKQEVLQRFTKAGITRDGVDDRIKQICRN